MGGVVSTKVPDKELRELRKVAEALGVSLYDYAKEAILSRLHADLDLLGDFMDPVPAIRGERQEEHLERRPSE